MREVVWIEFMVDRRAVTFRTLAVAAMIVLTIAPEALVHPSFQMSFAATLGLVALVQIGMPRLFASPDNSASARVALWGGREIATHGAGVAGGRVGGWGGLGAGGAGAGACGFGGGSQWRRPGGGRPSALDADCQGRFSSQGMVGRRGWRSPARRCFARRGRLMRRSGLCDANGR